MQRQKSDVAWREGEVPVSTRFDDPYFSLENGLDETRHVFLSGNDLPERFRDGFHVTELGFGTGLNFLATVQAWGDRLGRLHFTSFEAYPLERTEMARALAAFPGLDAAPLLEAWEPERVMQVGPASLRLVLGDARKTLPEWEGRADAWFLDGFSPAKNPELWEPSLLMDVAHHTAPGGTAATYSAAGPVRRALAEAGFTVERVPGFGRKRHMTRARMA